MSSLALAAFTFGSLLVGNPFTLPYAKETTPREYWDFPVFLRINRVITLVWALAFTVAAVAGLYGDAVLDQPDNFWTAWIIPIAAMLFAFSFSEWYPDVASAEAPRPPGEPLEVAPSLDQALRLLSSVRYGRRDRDARHRHRSYLAGDRSDRSRRRRQCRAATRSVAKATPVRLHERAPAEERLVATSVNAHGRDSISRVLLFRRLSAGPTLGTIRVLGRRDRASSPARSPAGFTFLESVSDSPL